jgi:O-antigen/teichoic acid export membrane protein
MSERRKTASAGLFLTVAQVACQALTFVRSVMIARLLGPQQFGVAAALLMTSAFIDMIGNMSADRLLVQADDGDAYILQRAAHLVQLIRGVLGAVAFYALAWPISAMFGVPELKGAFQWMAILPLLNSLRHTDSSRMQRQLRFMPTALVDLSQQVVGAIVGILLAYLTRSYIAVLCAILAQTGAAIVTSHLIADRRFLVGYDRSALQRIFAFGGPLLINCVLLFVIFQGDRVIVGYRFGLTALGFYSVAYNLTSMSTSFFARIANSLLLPSLSGAKNDAVRFPRRCELISQVFAGIAAAVGVGFIVGGGAGVFWIYGSKYAAAAQLIGWLAAAQAMWMIRVGPTLATMAKGDTMSPLIANIFRASALLGAAGMIFLGYQIRSVAIVAYVGETLSLAVLIYLTWKRHAVSILTWTWPSLMITGMMAFAMVFVASFNHSMPASIIAGCIGAAAAFGVSCIAFSTIRAEATGLLSIVGSFIIRLNMRQRQPLTESVPPLTAE